MIEATRRLISLAAAGLLAACGTPEYVDEGAGETATALNIFGTVVYQVLPAYRTHPPECVAVLALKTVADGESKADISFDQTETVRRAIYAHLSPQGKRDVELPRIAHVLKRLDEDARRDHGKLGRALNCDALITGEVTEYGSISMGFYSRIAVGANLKMVSTADGTLLWEGKHVAQTHGGGLPLSVVGLALNVLDAASNLREEQVLRVVDDLARRLVATIPDNRIAVLDDPAAPRLQMVAAKRPQPPETAETFIRALAARPEDQRRVALLAAIAETRFGEKEKRTLLAALIDLDPGNAVSHARLAHHLLDRGDYKAALASVSRSLELDGGKHAIHFLNSRILIKLGETDRADKAIVRAIALDKTRADYFNALGYLNSLRARHDRALAAYRMALDRDPTNGFAYYNTGVTHFQVGRMREAADAFYGAGLAYLKTGNYGQVTKIVADLKDIARGGPNLAREIETLEGALKRLQKEGGKNA